MLPVAHRLRGRTTFAAIARRGRSRHGELLAIKVLRTPPDKPLRVGIVISKKVSKRAVVRNRLRRQLRETLRPRLATLLPGFDVMILVKPTATAASRSALCDELRWLLQPLTVRKTIDRMKTINH